ncbi:unnamed protein product [Linum trigynum]
MDEPEDDMVIDGEREPDCPNLRIDRDTNVWGMRGAGPSLLGSWALLSLLFVQCRLQYLWATIETIKLASMRQGFYFVCFTTEPDYDKALYEGTWMIEDQYTLTRHWKQGFDPDEGDDVLTNILVGDRLPKLPMYYFDSVIL